MRIRIIKDTGPGCVLRPGSIVRMTDYRAQKLVEQGVALPTGQITAKDAELLANSTMAANTHRPLVGEDITSIIIPVFNQPGYVQVVLDSIGRFTTSPYEVIVVDNGSNSETKWVIRNGKPGRVITNSRNMGFPHAVNQGILAARGNRFCLLNSDTVVTQDWLSEMVRTLKSSDDIGLVGPTTNYSCGPQCDRAISTNTEFSRHRSGNAEQVDMSIIQTIAQRHSAKKHTPVDVLSGFCLLIDRRVVSEIGFFDSKTFGLGGGEERDFEDRAIHRGWRMMWAHGAYVHHYGHKSLRQIYHGKHQDQGRKNHQLFLKYQQDRQAGRRGIVVPYFDKVPVMFPTWDRLGYTKQALANLVEVTPDCQVCIYDDGSTDGTIEYLDDLDSDHVVTIVNNPQRRGIDNNMDLFFSVTAGVDYVAKIDNDTMVPEGWLDDLIAAIEATDVDVLGPSHFKNAMAKRKYLDPNKLKMVNGHSVYFNAHVGGLFVAKRSWMDKALDAGHTAYWKQYDKTPGGWTHFQETTTGTKAFYPDVYVRLLDLGKGKGDYPEYNAVLQKERRIAYGRLPEVQ